MSDHRDKVEVRVLISSALLTDPSPESDEKLIRVLGEWVLMDARDILARRGPNGGCTR